MGTQTNSTKTAHVMNLLGRETTDRILPARPDGTQPRDIEVITREILDAKRTGGEAVLTIGRGLLEAKAQLSHGEWLDWLETRVDISERNAQRFMRLAREYSNPTALSDLGATKALMLLAVPAEARDEFISEPHLVNGEEKTVIDMTTRELDAAIKERDAALLAAEQAKADQKAADEAREKMARDMAVANGRIAGLNAEVAEHSARVKEARDAAAEAQEAVVRMKKELEELRSRPVDVAVETDTAAIEAARKEAEAAMEECRVCDLIRTAAETLGVELPDLDSEDLSDLMTDLLQYGDETPEGVLAILYRALWAMADVRAKLSRYEDTGLEPEEVMALIREVGENNETN